MLQLLGNPKHVHFMVNPELGSIIVVPCEENVHDALKIKYGTGTECELYSTSLTRLLAQLNPNMDPGVTYRILGEANEIDATAIFSIKDHIAVDPNKHPERGIHA